MKYMEQGKTNRVGAAQATQQPRFSLFKRKEPEIYITQHWIFTSRSSGIRTIGQRLGY